MKLYWIGETCGETFEKITKEIFNMPEGDKREITLYISSPGGNMTVGLAFYDFVKAEKISLVTIGVGEVSSSAVLVLLSGKVRKATTNTFFLLHRTQRLFDKVSSFNIEELAIQSEIGQKREEAGFEVIRRETSFSEKELSNIRTGGGSYLNAQEALLKGIIHKII